MSCLVTMNTGPDSLDPSFTKALQDSTRTSLPSLQPFAGVSSFSVHVHTGNNWLSSSETSPSLPAVMPCGSDTGANFVDAQLENKTFP